MIKNRKWVFHVKDFLKPGNNEISLTFKSAIKYAAQKQAEYPYPLPHVESPWEHGEPHRNMIRKEQCSFSWDWFVKIYKRTYD